MSFGHVVDQLHDQETVSTEVRKAHTYEQIKDMACFDLDMKLWEQRPLKERTYEVLVGYIQTKTAKDNAKKNR